ncbi:hypothetical protein E4J89_00775 [Arthrobacter sp. CAU 1506]|uniref:type IV toxin-antitoxin system AbiEi family antitoxin domain-containing protein n=1 Tax=Arthrobacter sp. CAU 1506 TaxID=2560052 RepID=UPI0010ACF14B|nr:type IV toxin-antitoxin system AbiEi family antitoxin domain-containing protein [Arthrobacter sp. CAU 1506]TJY72266.1 hypothetical protein E4J89_00775 [Arthrobacter sp. CAU 1506]
MALALIYTRDYDRAGLDRQLLVREEKSGRLTRIRRGVYVPSAEYRALPWWEQRLVHLDAVVGTRRSEQVLIQQSAAAIWGIPTIGRSFYVLVLARNGTHGRARAGVRHHARVLLEPVVRHNGFMVTSRAQTAVDIAAYCRFEEAIPVMDHVLRNDRGRGLRALEPEQLSRLAELLPAGRRRRFERVLSFADPLA